MARCPPSLGGASGQLRSHNLDLEDPRNTEHAFLRAFTASQPTRISVPNVGSVRVMPARCRCGRVCRGWRAASWGKCFALVGSERAVDKVVEHLEFLPRRRPIAKVCPWSSLSGGCPAGHWQLVPIPGGPAAEFRVLLRIRAVAWLRTGESRRGRWRPREPRPKRR